MARQLTIEVEAGSCTGWRHPHNGYYAGDFAPVDREPVARCLAEPGKSWALASSAPVPVTSVPTRAKQIAV